MNELDLQDKYLVNFFCERPDGLQYKEAKANTVSLSASLISSQQAEMYFNCPSSALKCDDFK